MQGNLAEKSKKPWTDLWNFLAGEASFPQNVLSSNTLICVSSIISKESLSSCSRCSTCSAPHWFLSTHFALIPSCIPAAPGLTRKGIPFIMWEVQKYLPWLGMLFLPVDENRWIPHYRLTISEHIERITRGFGSARVDLALSENSVS